MIPAIIFISIGFAFILIPFHFKTKEIDNLKKHIHDNGGEFIELTWQPSPFKKINNDYLLVYSDKNKKLHDCEVTITVFGYKIIKDTIITRIPEPLKPLPELKVTSIKKFNTEHGEITIEQTGVDIEVGNKIFLNNKRAPDGKYKLGFLHYIYVKDSKIC